MDVDGDASYVGFGYEYQNVHEYQNAHYTVFAGDIGMLSNFNKEDPDAVRRGLPEEASDAVNS